MSESTSIAELRKICQSTAPNPDRESFVGRFSRVFSIYITRLLIPTKATPNQITSLGTAVFFIGIGLFFFERVPYWFIGCLLAFLSIILDGCDGEIARFKKNGGPVGTMYVEPVSHDIQYGLVFPILGFALYMHGSSWFLIIAGFVAGTSKLLFRLIEMRFWSFQHGAIIDDKKIESLKKVYVSKPLHVRFVYWLNKNALSSTGVFLLILVATIINEVDIYLYFSAIAYSIFFVALFIKQVMLVSKI